MKPKEVWRNITGLPKRGLFKPNQEKFKNRKPDGNSEGESVIDSEKKALSPEELKRQEDLQAGC